MIRLIELSRCAPGGGTFVAHDHLELAVFRLADDEVIVLDNACPHASGNLSGGKVVDGVVECPWHNWCFELRSGKCVHNEEVSVDRYSCEVRDGWVYADVERSL